MKELWFDTRLTEEEMNFLNISITSSIEKHAENEEKEHVVGNVFRDELIDKDNWFYETVLKKLSERMFYDDWDNYYKYVVDQEEPPPEFELENLWVNFQKKHDFVFLHRHDGIYSFVIFVKIPTHWKEQHVKPKYRNAGSVQSDFVFVWSEKGQSDGILKQNFQLSPEDEGRMLFFPAGLHHMVYPFYGTEEDRVTISGNIVVVNPNAPKKQEMSIDQYEEKKNVLKIMEESVRVIKEQLSSKLL